MINTSLFSENSFGVAYLRFPSKSNLIATSFVKLSPHESVTVSYHGKVKGVIKPVREKTKLKVADHPFFGMSNDNEGEVGVLEELENLRKSRYDF